MSSCGADCETPLIDVLGLWYAKSPSYFTSRLGLQRRLSEDPPRAVRRECQSLAELTGLYFPSYQRGRPVPPRNVDRRVGRREVGVSMSVYPRAWGHADGLDCQDVTVFSLSSSKRWMLLALCLADHRAE